jgi:hypothetical protein
LNNDIKNDVNIGFSAGVCNVAICYAHGSFIVQLKVMDNLPLEAVRHNLLFFKPTGRLLRSVSS